MSIIDLKVHLYQSPVGDLVIKADEHSLRGVSFAKGNEEVNISETPNPIIENTVSQLDEYFNGTRKLFQLPLGLHYHTVFQRLVWITLREIPFGKTKSYKQIAILIGKPTGFRAVGNACGQNNYTIIVPCHRAVANDGTIGGFSADIKIKEQLLEHEKNFL